MSQVLCWDPAHRVDIIPVLQGGVRCGGYILLENWDRKVLSVWVSQGEAKFGLKD